ncbi:precorrin-6y C5,15-methyltransferase (decarboxylating) subunit CbiE [Alkalihalobacterium alkalinitrilicum]|uniref:precorrin-6y C5,15-methyltransferase (decarboxylating) subunit CbiE n=1 Tax=Alkalihalobacterium alkalinitrilicum TaxID=427920 RepID=UPI000995C1F4|nr:precorrin-6y C5,15-methyltransferase (decarboxylating) subunit CbiE [Alkalihalobacterium alkalinitrilicum]
MGQPIKIIGITDGGKSSLLPIYEKWIYESECLIGGERQLQFFPEYNGDRIVLKGNLKTAVEQLQATDKRCVLLASGDPLFFGIGSYLSKKLPVEIYPNLSSIQEAFAKIQESWQDCTFISLHGRTMKGLAQKVDGRAKVCLLTDKNNTPATIAKYLLSYGIEEYDSYVAEALGGENEKVVQLSLEEMTDYEGHPLNIVILKRTGQGPNWSLGISDDEFKQRKPDKGLITKKEVRVLSLAELNLHENSVVWDIGTCTGSVAIESARIARHGQVYAMEKNQADYENCLENTKKFRADITVKCSKAPEGLEDFPNPDAIFIGGTGGEMQDLLRVCASRLNKGGRIVLNAATIETLYLANETFRALEFETSVRLVQISRSKPILHMNRFEGLNPIYIITAKHKEEQS